MCYYFTTTLDGTSFDQAVETVTGALKDKGFGIMTTIDVKQSLKEKLDKDFRPYTILGACNPSYAYRALGEENKIGTMLPCNVVVQQNDDGSIEVSAVDPIASMSAIDNPNLAAIATEVQGMLKTVIDGL